MGAAAVDDVVLLIHPGSADVEACRDAMGETTGTARLTVTYGGAGDVVTPSPEALPDVIGAVAVETPMTTAELERPPGFEGFVGVDSVEDPANLAEIGQSISGFCDRWSSDHLQTVLCYRSYHRVFEATSTRVALEFTRMLLDRLRTAGARAHFHLDPSTIDGATVETLEALFDDVEVLMRGAGIEEETETEGRPRFSRGHATDTEIASQLGEEGEPDEPTVATPAAESSDDEIASQLGGEDDEVVTPTAEEVAEVSDDEIATQLGDEGDGETIDAPSVEAEVSDDEIASRLGGDDGEVTAPTASEVSEVSDDEIAARLDDDSAESADVLPDLDEDEAEAFRTHTDGDVPEITEEEIARLLGEDDPDAQSEE